MHWFAAAVLVSCALAACESRRAAAPSAAEVTSAAACEPSVASAVCGPEGVASSAATASAAQTIDPEMAAICKQACAAHGYDESRVVPAPRAKHGDLTRCPVSGVVFEVDGDTPRLEHAGQSYWLCCDGCAERFRATPQRFAGS